MQLRLAGSEFAQDHEVATGEAMLQGQGKDAALQAGEQAKQS
jgi:hypothetical protein